MGKRLEQQSTVEALNGDRDALKKEGKFFVLSWDGRNASSKGVDEINSWTIHGTKILYCDWLKAVVREHIPVFFHFSLSAGHAAKLRPCEPAVRSRRVSGKKPRHVAAKPRTFAAHGEAAYNLVIIIITINLLVITCLNAESDVYSPEDSVWDDNVQRESSAFANRTCFIHIDPCYLLKCSFLSCLSMLVKEHIISEITTAIWSRVLTSIWH